MMWGSRRAVTAVAVVALTTLVPGWVAAPSSATDGEVVTDPTVAGTVINSLTPGPDGLTTWFTSFGSNEIGRITLATGAVTRYAVPNSLITAIECGPADITVSSNGEIWFTCLSNNELGVMSLGPTPVANTYNVPLEDVILPRGIAPDALGNVWFTSEGNNRVGRMDTVNFVTQTYDVSAASPAGCLGPAQITGGVGAMWFTCNASDTIGRIDVNTGVVSAYSDPDGDINRPWSILRRNGTFYFTNVDGNSIGTISETGPAGSVQSYQDPMGNIDRPTGLTTNGPELFFTSEGNNRIGRMSLSPVGFQFAMFEDPAGLLDSPTPIVWSYDQRVTFVGSDDRLRHLDRSGFGPHGFTDVPAGAFYQDGLRWASYHDIVLGYPDGTYRPAEPVKRGQVVNMLWTMMGSPPVATPHGFVDIPQNAFYEAALRWAKSLGLVTGFAGNQYRPSDPVRRGQIVNMLWKLTGQLPGDPHGFTDVPANAAYADALDWAASRHHVSGFPDGTYRPADPVKRQQIVFILRNLVADANSWFAVAAPDTALIS